MPEADRHDTGAIYKKLTINDLKQLVPEFDWIEYLNTFLPTQVTISEPIVAYALEYFQEMGKIIAQHDFKIIYNYAIWRMVKHILPFLDGEYGEKRAEFRKILLGINTFCIKY